MIDRIGDTCYRVHLAQYLSDAESPKRSQMDLEGAVSPKQGAAGMEAPEASSASMVPVTAEARCAECNILWK